MKQRIIKFRCYGEESKKWFYYDEIQGRSFIQPDQKCSKSYQYTGLKDKNGKEAYIGDILGYRDITKYGKNNGLKKKVIKESAHGWNVRDISQWKIIGNIYEGVLKEFEMNGGVETGKV